MCASEDESLHKSSSPDTIYVIYVWKQTGKDFHTGAKQVPKTLDFPEGRKRWPVQLPKLSSTKPLPGLSFFFLFTYLDR